jgi:PhzF family phenazine biosynthesis protein
MIWLEMIPPKLIEDRRIGEELTSSLGLSADPMDSSLPPTRTQDDDVLLFVRDVMTLNGAKPDFGALRRWCEGNEVRGVCLATVQTLTPSVSAQSRFFAPAAGINEDPVTGSVHAPLAAYLVKHRRVPIHDGLAGLMCVQGVPGGRTGVVYALVQIKGDDRYAVRVGGTAHTTMVGQLTA